MKSSAKMGFLIAIAVLSYLVSLCYTLPATRAYHWMTEQSIPVKLIGITGTAWSGKAQQVVWQKAVFTHLTWQCPPWRLLSLSLQCHIQLKQDKHHNEGDVEFNAKQITLENTQLAIGNVADYLDIGEVTGHIEADIKTLHIKQNIPQQCDAVIQWQNAVLGSLSNLNLGTITLQCQSVKTGINVAISSDGSGQLDTQGNVRLDTKGNYQVKLELHPHQRSGEVAQMLRNVGRPTADGSVIVELKGDLLALW